MRTHRTMAAALKNMLEGVDGKELRDYALMLCQDRGEAEDLVQEACFRALKAQAQFDPTRRLVAWVSRILRNAYYDSRRGAKLKVSLDEPWVLGEEPLGLLLEAVADGEMGVLEKMVQTEEAASIIRKLARLPRGNREAVVLCDLNGLKYEDAANELRISVGNLKSRLYRGRAMLGRGKTLRNPGGRTRGR